MLVQVIKVGYKFFFINRGRVLAWASSLPFDVWFFQNLVVNKTGSFNLTVSVCSAAADGSCEAEDTISKSVVLVRKPSFHFSCEKAVVTRLCLQKSIGTHFILQLFFCWSDILVLNTAAYFCFVFRFQDRGTGTISAPSFGWNWSVCSLWLRRLCFHCLLKPSAGLWLKKMMKRWRWKFKVLGKN